MSSLKFPLSDKEAKDLKIKKNATDNKNALFPTRLRELRAKKRTPEGEIITQQVLAEEIGVTKSTISLYEMGDNVPDAKTIVKIAGYYHVSTDYLLGRIDVKSPEIDNMAMHKKTGLSDEAIDNICSITSILFNYSETIDKKKNISKAEFTLEPKDILVEILASEKLLKLIYEIASLTNEYWSVKEVTPIFDNVKGKELPDDITNRFNYKLWIANTTAQKLISDVLESYYLKTKDGVVTYTVDLDKQAHDLVIENLPFIVKKKESK